MFPKQRLCAGDNNVFLIFLQQHVFLACLSWEKPAVSLRLNKEVRIQVDYLCVHSLCLTFDFPSK